MQKVKIQNVSKKGRKSKQETTRGNTKKSGSRQKLLPKLNTRLYKLKPTLYKIILLRSYFFSMQNMIKKIVTKEIISVAVFKTLHIRKLLINVVNSIPVARRQALINMSITTSSDNT